MPLLAQKFIKSSSLIGFLYFSPFSLGRLSRVRRDKLPAELLKSIKFIGYEALWNSNDFRMVLSDFFRLIFYFFCKPYNFATLFITFPLLSF